MQVERVEITPIRVPLGRVVKGSHYTKTHRGAVVVRIETNQDVSGHIYLGDVVDVNNEGRRLLDFLSNEFAPYLEGRNPFSVRAIWEELFERTERFSNSQRTDKWLYLHALSAIDTALWDTIGKAADIPLYQLWGGYRDSIPIIAIGGYYKDGKTEEDLIAEMKEYESMGISGVKMKVGGKSIEEDLERIRVVREEMGEEFTIACDSNQGYRADEAIYFGQRAAQYDLQWFEEPVVWHDQYRGMRELRDRIDIPIAAGQSESTAKGCQRLIEEGSVDILNLDASLAGGPTEWYRAAADASMNGVAMAHHREPNLAMHLLASIPHGLCVEVFHPDVDPIWYNMVTNRPTFRDGSMELPDKPGLGLDLDEDFIEQYSIKEDIERL